MTLKEILNGQTITEVRVEDGCIYLHIGRDKHIVALAPQIFGDEPYISVATYELQEGLLQ